MERPTSSTVREALAAWSSAGKPDAEFADDLERVMELMEPPAGNPPSEPCRTA